MRWFVTGFVLLYIAGALNDDGAGFLIVLGVAIIGGVFAWEGVKRLGEE